MGLLAQSLLVLPIPLLQGRVIDASSPWSASRRAQRGRVGRRGGVIAGALAATVACHLARTALAWRVAAMMGRISQEVVVALRAALHRKLMRLPMSYFDRSRPAG